ncbi:MAG: hypothetical protein IPL23_20080 [Saprospiraceae bacterium]|nr:hypothetical protein [Saprospiraceae bacterium]
MMGNDVEERIRKKGIGQDYENMGQFEIMLEIIEEPEPAADKKKKKKGYSEI